jgi:hypothetical protein
MREGRDAYRALVGKPEEGDHLEDPDVDGRSWVGGIDWINLAQDRDRWRALVYTVMNLRVL